LRESLPEGALPRGDKSVMKQHFQKLLERLAHNASRDDFFEYALDSLGDQFFNQLTMLPGNHFISRADLEQIDLETVLEKPPHTICRVVQSAQDVVIEFPGNRVAGPHQIASALRFVLEATRFAVRELPDALNARSKVVLARRLVREGLLTLVTQPQRVVPAAPAEQPIVSGIPSAPDANPDTRSRMADWETLEMTQPLQQPEVIVER